MHRDHKGYRLAFPHDNAYYDIPLVTFSLDDLLNVIVTFPIFIVPLDHQPFKLFEIETVPVPIPDLDPTAHSFSEVVIHKPYFAATESSYIQLREPELFRCKVVEHEFFCEETFMVKHSHHHTCESSLCFNCSTDLVSSSCSFTFFHNRSVTSSVLDGGHTLVLANVQLEHSPTCDPKHLPVIPTGSYILTSGDILCNCTLQSDLAYLPSDIGACPDTVGPYTFLEQPNLAFETIFKDLLNLTKSPAVHPEPSLAHTFHSCSAPLCPFPINLTFPHNISTFISSLHEAHSLFSSDFSSSFTANEDSTAIFSKMYLKHLAEVCKLIKDTHDEKFLPPHYTELLAIISIALTLLNALLIAKIFKDHRKLQTLTATLTLFKAAHSLQPTMAPLIQPISQVLCYDPIIWGTLTFLSTLSVTIIIYQQ